MPKKIVIIDDSNGARRQAKIICEDAGHKVVKMIYNMETAVSEIKAGLPESAVVLLDANLTNQPSERKSEDGQKLARLIREKNPTIKIIEYTNWHEPHGYGDAYVMKPPEKEAILNAIDSL